MSIVTVGLLYHCERMLQNLSSVYCWFKIGAFQRLEENASCYRNGSVQAVLSRMKAQDFICYEGDCRSGENR